MQALDLDGLRTPNVTVWSAWDGDGLVGCEALKQLDTIRDGGGHGELKSMRVADTFRGRGAGVDAFAPARTLYGRHGFVECGPFAEYTEDPWSVFMTLDLTTTAR